MSAPPPIVDARLHLENLSDADLTNLAFFGVKAAVLGPSDDAPSRSAEELFDYLRSLVVDQGRRLRAAKIVPFASVGIPARLTPERGVEALVSRLPTLFELGRVVALGGIGLYRGGSREEHAFLAQIALAHSLEMPVVVEIPIRDRRRILRRTLSILMESELAPERVLVGGIDSASFRLVRECGFAAGLWLHPSRLQTEDAVRLIKQHGPSGLVLASGAGAGPSDLLALARAVHLLEVAGISQKVARRVSRDNAIDFFGIDRSALPDS